MVDDQWEAGLVPPDLCRIALVIQYGLSRRVFSNYQVMDQQRRSGSREITPS